MGKNIILAAISTIALTLYDERNPLFIQQHYNPAYLILSILEDFA